MARIPDIMDLMGGGRPALDPTELRKFLSGKGAKNSYLNIGPYSAYLRRSNPRYLERTVRSERPLDLANIQRTDIEGQMDILPPEQRNPKGRLRELLALLEKEAQKSGYDSVYVENIVNRFLPGVLHSAGYDFDAQASAWMPEEPSMYKRL